MIIIANRDKKMKKIIIGYTQGTFDTLHYGHIRLLKNAKKYCDYLVVGVNSDRLVLEYKNKETIVKEAERKEIVESIKYCDKAIVVDSLDKIDKAKTIGFDICFIGSDWQNNPRWIETEKNLKQIGVKVVFLPYTKGISSSIVRQKIADKEKN